MVRVLACACALAAAAASAPAAGATPQLAQDAQGQSTLLLRVLNQTGRPLFTASADAHAPFGRLAPLAPPHAYGERVLADNHGGAVAAWIQPAEYEAPGPAMVAIKPPGGKFGTPVAVTRPGAVATRVELDVNGRGDAVVTWQDANFGADYSLRPAGGVFGPPEKLPGAPQFDVSVLIEASGGVVFVGSGIAPGSGDTRAYATYRGPDGGLREPQDLEPFRWYSPPVARNARGDMLLAWREGDEIMVRERPSGGDFGAARAVASVGAGNYSAVVRPSLNDHGDAMVLLGGQGLVAITRDGGGEFGPPVTLSEQPVRWSQAIGEDGAMRVAWIGAGRDLLVSRRAPGAAFGAPTRVRAIPPRLAGSGPPDTPPAVAIDGAGTETVVWEEPGGERVRVRERRASATGEVSLQTIATLPSFVREAPESACVPKGAKVLRRTERAVLTASGSYRHACLRKRGVSVDVGVLRPQGSGDTFLDAPLALAGPFGATVLSEFSHIDDTGTWVAITDLRDERSGESRSVNALAPGVTATVSGLRLAPSGAAAWVASAVRAPGLSSDERRLMAWSTTRAKPRLVAKGTRIVPRSLKLAGGRLTWREGKRRHSTRLR